MRSLSAEFTGGQVTFRSEKVKFGEKMKFFNKKGAYQMQFELRNTMVPVILLYDVKNVLKNGFEKYVIVKF